MVTKNSTVMGGVYFFDLPEWAPPGISRGRQMHLVALDLASTTNGEWFDGSWIPLQQLYASLTKSCSLLSSPVMFGAPAGHANV
jgi:hypothetical protein